MDRPSIFPVWATSGSVVEPSSEKKSVGWQAGEKPKASYQNWLHATTEEWLEYIDQEITTAQEERAKQKIREQFLLATSLTDQGMTGITGENSIIYVSSLDLLITCGTSEICTSSDGRTWTERQSDAFSKSQVLWNGTQLIALTFNATSGYFKSWTSTDGITWTDHQNDGVVIWAAWSPTLALYVGAAVNIAGSYGNVYSSTDGITWTSRGTITGAFQGASWSPTLGLFVIVGYTGSGPYSGLCYTSPNGVDWTARTIPDAAWKEVYWYETAGKFVAVAEDGTIGAYSANGIDWTQIALPDGARGRFFESPSCLMIGGTDSVLLATTDAVNWYLVGASNARHGIWHPVSNKFIFTTGEYSAEVPAF